jgi:dihydrofolate reductase
MSIVRKIVNGTYMTLDGDISNVQNWHWDYVSDEAKQAAHDQLFASDALIMGRRTYEGFAPVWSKETGDLADRMNAIPKYVLSTTLTNPTWNASVLDNTDIVGQIRKLKEQPGQNILQYGFGSVTRLLLDNGLLDELRIWLHPVLSGQATPDQLLFRESEQHRFTHIGTETHGTGLILLTYQPIR